MKDEHFITLKNIAKDIHEERLFGDSNKEAKAFMKKMELKIRDITDFDLIEKDGMAETKERALFWLYNNREYLSLSKIAKECDVDYNVLYRAMNKKENRTG